MIIAYNTAIGEIHSVHKTDDMNKAKEEALQYLRDNVPPQVREQVERDIQNDRYYLTNHGVVFYDIGNQAWVDEFHDVTGDVTSSSMRAHLDRIFERIRTVTESVDDPFKVRLIVKALILYFKQTMAPRCAWSGIDAAFSISEFRRGDMIHFELLPDFRYNRNMGAVTVTIPKHTFPNDQYEPMVTEEVNTKVQEVETDEQEV